MFLKHKAKSVYIRSGMIIFCRFLDNKIFRSQSRNLNHATVLPSSAHSTAVISIYNYLRLDSLQQHYWSYHNHCIDWDLRVWCIYLHQQIYHYLRPSWQVTDSISFKKLQISQSAFTSISESRSRSESCLKQNCMAATFLIWFGSDAAPPSTLPSSPLLYP